MKRLLTAAVGIPLALAAVFRLPPLGFFVLIVLLLELGVLEYARLGRRIAPGAPLPGLLAAVPLAAFAGCLEPLGRPTPELGWEAMLAVAAAVPLGFGVLILAWRLPARAAVSGLGLLAFGLPYFAVPIVSLCHLQRRDPGLLLLLLAIVWFGDSAAYYLGSRWGRRKLAPVMSPNKSWEGAVAGLLASALAAVAWSLWRQGGVDTTLLALTAVTAVAAQLGDLVESALKRAAEVKDSGDLLPGHGGVLDRMDALLFAAPVWYLGLRFLGAL
jgi:phosphatidate cytidylyltransferase